MASRSSSASKSRLNKEGLDAHYAAIQKAYLSDGRPWVVGYSGGKDSTATLQSVWYALSALPKEKLHKKVYVISSDTLVETPVIVNYIAKTTAAMATAARDQGLPFETVRLIPQTDDTFWVNLIGRGYPAPYNRFRWCTDRLKIRPANKFIKDTVADYGEALVVLGARKAESATRSQVMSSRKGVGEMFSRHSNLPNAWVYTPIEDWTTDEVWEYLIGVPSPWGGRNHELVTMYRNAQAGECPLVIDKSTPSCGNSRFGCWICTVVTKDTSMEAMIDSGEDWLEPLLRFRDLVASTQDPAVKRKYRNYRRRSGQVHTKTRGDGKGLILGPYYLWFRKQLLKELLAAQETVRSEGPEDDATLITEAELARIRQLWRFEEGDWEDSLPRIYEEVTGRSLHLEQDDWSGLGKLEHEVLAEVCEEAAIPVGLLSELFDAERKAYGMGRRAGIFEGLDRVIRKDWRTEDEVYAELEDDDVNGADDEELE